MVRRNTHGGETVLDLRAVRKNTHEGLLASGSPARAVRRNTHEPDGNDAKGQWPESPGHVVSAKALNTSSCKLTACVRSLKHSSRSCSRKCFFSVCELNGIRAPTSGPALL